MGDNVLLWWLHNFLVYLVGCVGPLLGDEKDKYISFS